MYSTKSPSPILLFVALAVGASTGPADAEQAHPASFDNVIVPRARVGPVVLGGSDNEAARQLGRPHQVRRHRPPRASTLPVSFTYVYRRPLCLELFWDDAGVAPPVLSVYITCDRWRTAEGLGVGSLPEDVISRLGNPEVTECSTRTCFLSYHRLGLRFWARSRASPIHQVQVLASP